jgi:O-antigen/teichoic acid export membrane protein
MINRLKNLASDTAVYGLFTIVGRFLTFLLTPLYTNYLSIEEVGDIVFIFSIIAFLNIIYSFGMDSAFFRFYSKDKPEQTKKVFSSSYFTILIISGIITLIFLLFAGLFAPGISDLPNATTLIRYAALIPFLDALMFIPYSYLRMTRQAKKFATAKFFLIIITVGMNFLLVVFINMGAEGVLLSQLTANLMGLFFFVPLIYNQLDFRFDFKLIKDMFRYGLPTMPASFSAIILQIADRPVLKALTDSAQLGIYGVNYRLGIPMMMFVSVFEYAWKPFYLSHYEDEDSKVLFKRVLTYFTLACAFVFLIVGFFIEYVVRMPFIGGNFINPEYWEGLGIIPIILIAYYFNGMFNNFAAGFHITKKTDYLPVAVGVAAISNIGLNFLLIPSMGYWGSAWATLISYVLSAVVLYYFSRKVYPINYEWKRILLIAAFAGIIYFLGTYLTGSLVDWASFAIRIGGVAVFVALLFLSGFFTPKEREMIGKVLKKARGG